MANNTKRSKPLRWLAIAMCNSDMKDLAFSLSNGRCHFQRPTYATVAIVQSATNGDVQVEHGSLASFYMVREIPHNGKSEMLFIKAAHCRVACTVIATELPT